MFTRAEGIVLSPHAMYTVKEVIEQALRCKGTGSDDTILFTVTPAVSTDSTPYDSLLDGLLHDEKTEEASLKKSLGRFIGRN
jgi:tryptophan synthase beta chain